MSNNFKSTLNRYIEQVERIKKAIDKDQITINQLRTSIAQNELSKANKTNEQERKLNALGKAFLNKRIDRDQFHNKVILITKALSNLKHSIRTYNPTNLSKEVLFENEKNLLLTDIKRVLDKLPHEYTSWISPFKVPKTLPPNLKSKTFAELNALISKLKKIREYNKNNKNRFGKGGKKPLKIRICAHGSMSPVNNMVNTNTFRTFTLPEGVSLAMYTPTGCTLVKSQRNRVNYSKQCLVNAHHIYRPHEKVPDSTMDLYISNGKLYTPEQNKKTYVIVNDKPLSNTDINIKKFRVPNNQNGLHTLKLSELVSVLSKKYSERTLDIRVSTCRTLQNGGPFKVEYMPHKDFFQNKPRIFIQYKTYRNLIPKETNVLTKKPFTKMTMNDYEKMVVRRLRKTGVKANQQFANQLEKMLKNKNLKGPKDTKEMVSPIQRSTYSYKQLINKIRNALPSQFYRNPSKPKHKVRAFNNWFNNNLDLW